MIKYKNFTALIYLLFLILLYSEIFSQQQPVKDSVMPDYHFSNVYNYNKKHVNINRFKGKWLMLDFWTVTCKSCIASFDKMNKLQEQFSDNLQILLVGSNEQHYGKGIEDMFRKLVDKKQLKIPSAFDSVPFKSWTIESVPYIYIIDPGGVLRFITDGRDMTADKIGRLIRNEKVSLHPKAIQFKPIDSFLTESINSESLYSSVLTKWNGETQGGVCDAPWIYAKLPSDYHSKGWYITMAPLYELYNHAYWGRGFWYTYDTMFYKKVWPYPILEISDSSAFQYDYKFDVGKATYNYYFKASHEASTEENVKSALQNSLHTAFGYKVKMETREMPVWLLTMPEHSHAKLKTKGGEEYFSGYGTLAAGFKVKNYPISKMIDFIGYYLGQEHLFFDETGINYNIDLSIKADMTNVNSMIEEFEKAGLRIVKGKRNMKVIVISDK